MLPCINAQENTKDNSARSWVLIEATTGYMLRGENEHEKIPAGAMNKLMTALIVAEKIEEGVFDTGTLFTASQKAHEAGGAVIWLDAGEKISVEELLKGLLIGNANDAAIVFAEEISGDTDRFVEYMNRRAKELGMNNTYYTSCANHDDENQYTTAYDTALLTAEVSTHTFLYEIMNTRLDYIRDKKTELVNENTLIDRYRGIIGVKASHTEATGYSVTAAAQRDDEKYVVSVMGCTDNKERFSIATELLDSGFNIYKTVLPGFSEEYMKPLDVKKGTEFAVEVKLEEYPLLVIPKSKESELSVVIFMPEYIKAPFREEHCVGTAAFYCGDTLMYETKLVTKNSVDKNTFFKSVTKLISKMFK